MNDEERDIITRFVQRVSGAAQPGSPAPALPPPDRDADALIGDLFARFPEARYRITQTAFIQEMALTEAHNRLQQMQAELEQTRAQLAQAQQQAPAAPPAPAPRSSFFAGMFGAAAPAPAPASVPAAQPRNPWGQPMAAPAPGYAPGYQPQPQPQPQPMPQPMAQQGMFQRSGGSGFLGSALTTAAGVAGGMMMGNALMGLFSGHSGYGGMGGGFGGGYGGMGAPVNETTIVNNYGTDPQAADPGQAGWDNGQADNGWGQQDNGGFDQTADSGQDFGGQDFGGQDSGFDSGGDDLV